MAFDGATNAECFAHSIEHCLVPSLRPGAIVIMDNLSSHKTARVAELIGSAGASVRLLPAYNPDLNPIEMRFSKLKAALRSAAARTFDALIEAMGRALRSILPSDIVGWFSHQGYRRTASTGTANKLD